MDIPDYRLVFVPDDQVYDEGYVSAGSKKIKTTSSIEPPNPPKGGLIHTS
jgi:hypothetical protein